MSNLRKDPRYKAEEKERDRIRKKNNKIQKQIDSIFKLEENDKLFNRNYLYADRLCDFKKIHDWMHPIDNDIKDVNGHNFRKLIDNYQKKIQKLIDNSKHACARCDVKFIDTNMS